MNGRSNRIAGVALAVGLVACATGQGQWGSGHGANTRTLIEEARRLGEADPRRAVSAYERALTQASDDQGLWLDFARCLRRSNRLSRALQAGWRAVEIDASRHEAWDTLGDILVVAKAWDGADAAFARAAKLGADKREVSERFVSLGHQLWLTGDDQGALHNYDRALEFWPESAAAHYKKAMLYGARGDRRQAQEHATMARRLLEETGMLSSGDGRAISVALTLLEQGEVTWVQYAEDPYQVVPDSLVAQPPAGRALSQAIDGSADRIYPITGVGRIAWTVPEGWGELSEKLGAKIKVRVMPSEDAWDELVLTVAADTDAFDAQQTVRATVADLRGGRALGNLELHRFETEHAAGYWTWLTDTGSKAAATKPTGEYPYVLAVMARADDAAVAVTVLGSNVSEERRQQLMAGLETLRLQR